ncbi:Histone chaperone ASF1 [Nakaseomyces glabratus]|nr:Histone chaperone ASF1 [Nakaseomyces glabratus]KTB27205.1 Histone chaperone ASF1 [Nakaseomyces glabratus]
MSIVSLLGIKVLNNPAKFTDPYEFEITFECLEPLKNDLEWKLTYVGSSRSLEHDQELDSILVGPVPVGVNKFVFTADPPSAELIPASELVSVTVILLSCSYDGREFVRVGYYVNNEYDSEELRENPPQKVQVDHIVRNILAEKPRVTRFNIVWDNENEADIYPPEQPGVDEEDEAEEEEEEEEEEEAEDEEEEVEVDVDGEVDLENEDDKTDKIIDGEEAEDDDDGEEIGDEEDEDDEDDEEGDAQTETAAPNDKTTDTEKEVRLHDRDEDEKADSSKKQKTENDTAKEPDTAPTPQDSTN